MAAIFKFAGSCRSGFNPTSGIAVGLKPDLQGNSHFMPPSNNYQ